MAHVLDPLWWPIGDIRTRTAAKRAFSCPWSPTANSHFSTWRAASMSSDGIDNRIRNMSLPGAPPTSYRKDQLHPRWIYFLTPQDTDCPNQPARRETLTEWRAETVSGICQPQPKRTPAAITRSISASAISGLVRATRCSTGTPARIIPPDRSSNSREQTQCDHHRNFTARKRQRHQRLAIGRLPSVEAYCGATPTERSPLRHRCVVDDQRPHPCRRQVDRPE